MSRVPGKPSPFTGEGWVGAVRLRRFALAATS